MFLRFLNFSPRVMLILTANCFIVFMKITQIQPCILWKTTPVDNPLHKPARTLKHSQTPPMPTFHPHTPLPIHLPTFPSPSNPASVSRQHRASTSPAHNQAKPSKIVSHEQKGAPIATKTTEITPPSAHIHPNPTQIANRAQKRVSHNRQNQRNHTPSAHERAKLTRIASRERKRVSYGHQNR